MDVIIVSKTHMHTASCVGGVLANGRSVRLLDSNGHNQGIDTPLNIGDVWIIEFEERAHRRPPHIEDVLVTSMSFKFAFSSISKMVDHLKEKSKIKIWEGSPDILFDGKIQWTSGGSGYISETGEMPDNSIGFWIPDKDLTRKDYEDKVKFTYASDKIELVAGFVSTKVRRVWRTIPYVGFQTPVDSIPAGTLVRVSLARWWTPNEDEERCYLQLSGWYI